ncbi:hypothetical protein QNI19_28625 [Cytophagaceae bacterium DM2B3-1]|uniref:Uncharacterized protein n=1 Tax=Xanthocytophaga flava TaxID=3048013 RepID=A0ABT7CT42_9BACT|nr:hypothetical protein [Xanthocytophaga flavus]MDJ1496935.1 hypothetical protein [Xanthocytophaga flavus]
MDLYIVKYSGPFGFIKPWTAVRDSETFSQQFLTPSIVEGIEKKLFPELLRQEYMGKILKIKRHRLNYQGIDIQQERTWAKGGFSANKEKGIWKTNMGILNRGVMLNPNLYLAFENKEDAEIALTQTICLCRNEDLLFPEEIQQLSNQKLDEIDGFELIFSDAENGFKVGHNRFNNASEMYGMLKVFGNPIRE